MNTPTRKNKLFLIETVAQALPGTVSEIATRSGFSRDAVRGALALLGDAGRAYALRWVLVRNVWALSYARGKPPAGYAPPVKPPPLTPQERTARWLATPAGRAKAAALSLAAYHRKQAAELARMKDYRDRKREELNRKKREKAAKQREAKAKREAAMQNTFLQLSRSERDS